MICGGVLIAVGLFCAVISLFMSYQRGMIAGAICLFLGVFLVYDLPRLINRPDLTTMERNHAETKVP